MKLRDVPVILILVMMTFTIKAQDTTYWKKGGVTSVTFTQVSLKNWAAGGDNSVSLNGLAKLYANYKKENITWKNTLNMGYGLIKQGKAKVFRKTDDNINFVSQVGVNIRKDVLYWSSLIDFRTQFEEGVDEDGNRISKFMSPGYLLVASGLDWSPNEYFSFTYAPATGKFTFVLDQELANSGSFGVDAGLRDPITGSIVRKGKSSRSELGSFLKAQFVYDVIKNVNLDSRLELFTNYLDNESAVDVNWQNLVVMKINGLLTTNLQTQILYDKDIKKEKFDNAGELVSRKAKVQLKSVFGVGVTYKFGDVKN
jgi:hypothetical protein